MNSNNSEPLFDMVVPLATYKHVDKATKDRTTKSGKFLKATPRKEFIRLALNNNIQKWFRHQKTEVKNNYKQLLRDFYFPTATEKHRSATITYIINRHTKQRIDADAISWSAKWIADLLVELGHLVDDDDVTFVFKPAVYTEGNAETQVRCIFQPYTK